MGRQLTLLSAPAGFGKSTLVSEWVVNCERPVAWLSLDEGDNDPKRFLTYLVAALQTLALPQKHRDAVGPDKGIAASIGAGALGMLQSLQSPSIESILTTLLNEIAASLGNFIIVLDDYHTIESKPVDEALTFLLEHQPPQMHLVIATREDPSLPLARLRARGHLTELRAAELRFTPVEAADFLNRMMGLDLSEANIAALEARTEGWIAGLQLAALSMQGRSDAASFIKTFTGSHHFILDYLVEEVLGRQPEHVRNFLLQTAILDRFSSPLCNAVTGQEDGRGMLEALERGNLFVIPLDDQRQWYRYHHLFADVLQTHLTEALPDRVAALHERASAWYERNGLRSDAIRHALAAKDFEHAADLIELAGPGTEDGSIQQATWLGWVKMLSDELVHARPVLTVWYAYVLLGRGELEAAESRFKDAERWLESADTVKIHHVNTSAETYPESNRRMAVVDQEQFESLPATIAIGRAYIAQALGDIPDTVRYARQVLELVPEGDNFRHAQASMLLGMSHWASGDLKAADRVFAEYTMKLRMAGNLRDAISTSVVLADIRLALGHLREAIETVEQCLRFVMDQGEPLPPDTADLHRELSVLYLEQRNLDVAAHHLQLGRELGEKAGLPILRYRLYVAQARLKETQADLNGALAMLDEANRLYVRSPLPDFGPIPARKARIWVVQGRLTEALGWAREQGLSVEDNLSYLREFEHITLARILVAQYQKDRTEFSDHVLMQLLDRLLHAAEEGGRLDSVIEILILQALARKSQGALAPALVPLERALTLAEPEGYVRIFVDEGEAMRLLILDFRSVIEKSVRNGVHPLFGYVDKLLSIFPQPAATTPKLIINNLNSEIVEPLSEHELEVLRLLRTELSGPEIARERMVSLSTIRTHTQHIYTKLGVNNRRAAVHRAEELGLL